MCPSVVLHPTPLTFLDRAGVMLMRHEAEHSLLLGIASSLPPQSSGALLATVEENGEVIAVALRTPPRKLLVSDGPPGAIDALCDAMRRHAPDLPGITGPAAAVERFAMRYSDQAVRELEMRLHRLDAVTAVPRPPGHVRVATPADAESLAPWAQRFVDDSGSDETRPGAELLAPYLANGTLYLWEDGTPTSMAGWSRGTAHGASVSMVYTPSEHRGQGYATALVAELSRTILARGKRFCVLFTNLANPTANAIYARIGYQPLCDHGSWKFPKS
ncbi:GNAT family N-acetyltransferase [Paraliomyxa miuraensis]|uniref:GNAT family N-acetyltransferase n=1 Tax=Paraliomyxa miuraensis TaxID=376150 RepID=UPI002256193E|nr:GNAT family N-acetyltransferase [Paraliomyxa miuraensis]MCX4240243.1 GNAT family N-acetyltransferase [Paraliomyxa miuraensis]